MRRRVLFWVGLGLAAAGLTYWICAPRGSGFLFSPSSLLSKEGSVRGLFARKVQSERVQQQTAESEAADSIKRQRRAEAYAAATAAARSLLTKLTEIDPAKPLNYEMAEKWKQALAELVAQGPAAIPAIREYLQKNEDINISTAKGGILLGEPSLRAALLHALNQIGGQEASNLMVETLKGSVTPSEIALLAGYLDQQSPGRYNSDVITAANDAFKLAAEGQLPGWDVAPLFQLIQRLDSATAATAAQNLVSQWKCYSALTLAGLQGGEGINALIQQARDPGAGAEGQNEFALQMIAQVSAQFPQASSALLQQARQGQIPDSAWPKIAMALGGDQYSMISLSSNGQPELPSVSGLKTYHLEAGNQNFYSVPLAAIASPESAIQRRDIIDKLLALNPGEVAVESLKQARAQLTMIASR
jgi:hypothetical protein